MKIIMNRKLTSNYAYTLLFQGLNVLTPLITTPYVSRILQPEGVGIISYTVAIATFFAMLAATGVGSYGQREIAYFRDDPDARSVIFWELFWLRTVTTLLIGAVYIGVCFYLREYTTYLLWQSIIVFSVILDVSWFFQGIEEFKIVTIRNSLVKLTSVILVFIIIKDASHLGRYILVNSCSNAFSLLLFLPELRKYVKPVPVKQLNMGRHFRGNLELFIPVIATQIYTQLDKVMLGAMTSTIAENGYYEQARKITSILTPLLAAINTVLFPRVANLYIQQDYDQIKKFHRQTFNIILMLIVPLVTGLWIISDNFVVWFLGEAFIRTSILIKLSGWILLFMCVGNFVGVQMLMPTGRQNQMTTVYMIAAAMNVVLNGLLIPRYLAVGAIVASMIAEAFSCFAQVYLLKKSEFNFPMLADLPKYLGAAAAMVGVLLSLHVLVRLSGPLATIADIAVGAATYFSVLLLLREEMLIQVLTSVLPKSRKK